jgi:hypothetical protein
MGSVNDGTMRKPLWLICLYRLFLFSGTMIYPSRDEPEYVNTHMFYRMNVKR